MSQPERPPLVAVRGDASPEEIAALVVALQGLVAAAESPPTRPRPEWAAPRRTVRAPLTPGPGGWRSSALPQ